MAFEIEFIEGFDASGGEEDSISHKWAERTNSGFHLSSSVKRGVSGYSLELPASGNSYSSNYVCNFSKGYRCLIVGFAYYCQGVAAGDSNNPAPISFKDSSGGSQVTLKLNAASKLDLYRVDTSGTLLASGTTVLQADTWYYIELKVFVDSTSGAYELKIDETTEYSASSVNTKGSTTQDAIYNVRFCNHGLLYYSYIDDIYIKGDPTSNTAGGFLGDVHVTALFPDADGTHSDFTRSTGTVDYTLIDEAPPSTADYLESSTSADKFSVSHSDLVLSGDIIAVQQQLYNTAPDGTVRNIKGLCRSNSTDYTPDTKRSSNQVTMEFIYEVDPNTSSAWTATNLNAAEFGIEIV
jgi:hypothetical protein